MKHIKSFEKYNQTNEVFGWSEEERKDKKLSEEIIQYLNDNKSTKVNKHTDDYVNGYLFDMIKGESKMSVFTFLDSETGKYSVMVDGKDLNTSTSLLKSIFNLAESISSSKEVKQTTKTTKSI